MGRTFRAALVGFCIILLSTYPSSPVLFMAFMSVPYIIYPLIIVAMVSASAPDLRFKKSKLIFLPGTIRFAVFMLLFSGLLTYVATKNPTALRELSTLIGIVFVAQAATPGFIRRTTRWIIYIYTAMLLLSICVALLYMPFHKAMDGWNVAQGIVPPPNPIILRSEWGDFDYYFPFFLSVIPVDEFFNFDTRIPLLFTESTYLYYFTLPILGMVIIDNSLLNKRLIVIVLLAGLILGRSYVGISLMFFGLGAVLIIGHKRRSMMIKVSYALVGFILFTMLYAGFEDLILGSKQGQIEKYIINGVLANGLPDGGFLGKFNGSEHETLNNDYGVLTIIGRYGISGAFSWVIFLSSVIFWGGKMIRISDEFSAKLGYALFFISSAIMGFKVPYFANNLLIFLASASALVMHDNSVNKLKTTG